MKWRRNIAKNFNRLTNVTDRRQTDRREMTYLRLKNHRREYRPAIQACVCRTWWYHNDGRYNMSPGPTVTSSGRTFMYWG